MINDEKIIYDGEALNIKTKTSKNILFFILEGIKGISVLTYVQDTKKLFIGFHTKGSDEYEIKPKLIGIRPVLDTSLIVKLLLYTYINNKMMR